MPLKMDGKVFDPNAPKANELRILEFLKQAPRDEVFSMENVTEQLGLNRRYLKDIMAHSRKCFDGYTTLYRRQRYWGHPEAIAELSRAGGQ